MSGTKLRAGIVGGFQIGKSTLVNCMLDGKFARTGGMGVSVTAVPTRYVYGPLQGVQLMQSGQVIGTMPLQDFLSLENIPGKVDEIVVTAWRPALRHIDLVDTPGFKATDKDTQTTEAAIRDLDFIIVLLNNKSLDAREAGIFTFIYRLGKPFMVVVNCINQGGALWDPAADANRKIFAEIESRINNIGGKPVTVAGKTLWMCNLLWYWYASGNHLLDAREAKEDTAAKMAYFTEHFLRIPRNDYKSIAEKSQVPPLLALFEDDQQWGFPINFIRWNAGVSTALNSWRDTLNKLITNL